MQSNEFANFFRKLFGLPPLGPLGVKGQLVQPPTRTLAPSSQPASRPSPSSQDAVGKPLTPSPAQPPSAAPIGTGGTAATSPVSPPSAFSRFEKACRYTLENEDGVRWDHDQGSFTNNPKDPGGATMWGVILTEYEAYTGRPLTPAEVAHMPREIAIAILNKKFWVPAKCGLYLSDTSAMAIFDVGMNKGLGGLKVILQDACHTNLRGEVWEYGEDAVKAVNSMGDQEFLDSIVRATRNYIIARIIKNPNMEWARAGWNNRANRMRALAVWSPK